MEMHLPKNGKRISNDKIRNEMKRVKFENTYNAVVRMSSIRSYLEKNVF